MRNPLHPQPAPAAFGENEVVPEAHASALSRLTFHWLSRFLDVGFSRPLEKDDLWQLPQAQLTDSLTKRVEANFYARVPPEDRPAFLRPSSSEATKFTSDVPTAPSPAPTDVKEKDEWPEKDVAVSPTPDSTLPAKQRHAFSRRTTGTTPIARRGKSKGEPKYDRSLLRALHTTFWVRWWIAGAIRLVSDTLKTLAPLVTKELLAWLSTAYAWNKLNDDQREASGLSQPKGVGYGIGLAFALFIMQEVSSVILNHHWMLTLSTGIYVRTAVIGVIFRKSLRLSGKSRADHSVGQITTMISADASRLDTGAGFFHQAWIAPIQITIGVGLLIGNLGYSALVGFAVLLLGFPLQFILVRIMFNQRKKGVAITDRRVRLTNEVLQGVRLIKYYAWEAFYAHQITVLRRQEIKTIRASVHARAWLIALLTFIPVLASVLSFVTYALSGHDLDVAIIFSSLQYFNIIRQPLVMLPFVFNMCSDAAVALGRIQKFLNAEELPEPYAIDTASEHAVSVDGDFRWEATAKATQAKFEADAKSVGRGGNGGGNATGDEKKGPAPTNTAKTSKARFAILGRKNEREVLPSTTDDVKKDSEDDEKEPDEEPFALRNLHLTVPKGAFVAIVGRIGSGKSSLLQAMIGEMRRTRGQVQFGGSVAYVPQAPWIMNATLRGNILFGRDEDEAKFRDVVQSCCLERDLAMLPHGDATEIGERGINLSGGQKARVSMARAVYANTDIVLLDDCLSAVDAHTGKDLLERCLLGALAKKTRVLVTHALHVLDKTDYIYVMDEGKIVEQGTYTELRGNSHVFSRLLDEYGKQDQAEEEVTAEEREETAAVVNTDAPKDVGEKKAQAALMQQEERATGAVGLDVYLKYFKNAGSVLWAPIILILLVLGQAANVGNNLFLGFWTSKSIRGFSQGEYMAIYTGLGVATAVFAFFTAFAFSLVGLAAGLRLFKAALRSVLRSPVSFFDTTPMGRIVSRLSKDQDTVDNELSMTSFQLLSSFMNVLGTVVLVFYTFPYLGIIFIPLGVFYYLAALYYRRTSVETKRLDSLMRSALYASYSETLTGLSTVRAYREQNRFIRNADHSLDLENRAFYMTVAIQTWLGLRLDLLGNLLILGIGLFAAGERYNIDPAKVGVVLSYSLGITMIFSQMVQTYAMNEQNMNAVERVLVYTELPSEGAQHTPEDPPASWPSKGEVKFENVELAYRPGLPLVLKGVTFTIHAGEKVGIVGRTGAGKSSLLQALFRMVELQSGRVAIDDVNIREIGLDALRGRLALVPQDSVLFLGTLRENLDPQATRTDAELISALQRAWLLPREGSKESATDVKFRLDAPVSDEGSNYSAGEKQLLALCRALVKKSRIIVLDEATSSVDVETDAKLQKTIQTEFAQSTLLCVAHRLNTIAFYDRILVMDAGTIAEFDSPLNLFDKEDSIFRSLCNEASLSREDIVRIRASVEDREGKTP